MDDKEKDQLAHELIEITALAIKELYGDYMPQDCKQHAKKCFEMSKKGAPRQSAVQQYNREIAIRLKAFRIADMFKNIPAIQDAIEQGELCFEKNLSSFVEKLSTEFIYDAPDIYKIEKAFEKDSLVFEESLDLFLNMFRHVSNPAFQNACQMIAYYPKAKARVEALVNTGKELGFYGSLKDTVFRDFIEKLEALREEIKQN